MAKITSYTVAKKIPGLPDTTNIQDKQLRLLLDRLSQVCLSLETSVQELYGRSDIENIVAELMKNKNFNTSIDKKVKDTAKAVIPQKTSPNKDEDNLLGLVIHPASIQINTLETNSANVSVDYLPSSVPNRKKGVSWSSSDTNVAVIDQTGAITAVANGECVITATSKYDPDIFETAYLFAGEITETTVQISAPYVWSSTNASVYTENVNADVNDRIWQTASATITVNVKEGETEEQAVEKAKDNYCYSKVVDRVINQFINIPETLWKQPKNASDYLEIFNSGQYTYLTLRRYTIAGRDADTYGDHLLFIEPGNIMVGGNTGMVFSAASDTIEASAERLEIWDSDKYLAAEDLPFISASDIAETEAVNYTLVKHYSDITSGVGYGYIKKTGNTKTLTYIPPASGGVSTTESFSEYTTWDEKYSFWQSDTTSVIYPSEPYVDSSEIYWDYIKPDNIDPATGEVAIQIEGLNNNLRFTYGGRWYGGDDANGYVFVIQGVTEWQSVPTSATTETAYTASGNLSAYYLTKEDAENGTNPLAVSSSGHAVYQIKDKFGQWFFNANTVSE